MRDSITGVHNVWKKKENSKEKYNYMENESMLENSKLWIKTECMGEVFLIYPLRNKVLITKNHMDFACIEEVEFQ